MPNPVLGTKLYLPRQKPQLVSRPRLLEKLDPLLARKLTLISAPAGFGKSTLLAEWIQLHAAVQPPVKFSWLTLDDYDNAPERFLAYLVAALQRVQADVGADILPVLDSIQMSPSGAIWEALAAEIAAIPYDFVLVLDDYHAIQASAIHEGLLHLLEKAPARMHLVISTRADPPLTLARLRVQGELGELRAADLRFNSEETADFMERWLGRALSTSDRAELEERTEGWAAGLQLAALAMQALLDQTATDEGALSDFIHRLSGNSRFIMDYLVEEVLGRLPETQRSFLLETCLLERLSAPLCDAVTGRSDSQSMLDSLEKTNLFLFPLDDERRWFRYHHLFADLLFSFLQHEQAAEVPELHRKASAWYESNGWTAEAIHHALKIPDVGRAAGLMEDVAPELVRRGEVTTVQNWCSLLSDEQLQQSRTLCACLAWSFLCTDQVEMAEHYLSLINAGQAVTPASFAGASNEAMAAYSMVAYYRGNYQDAIEFARRAEQRLSPEQLPQQSVVALSSASALAKLGEDEAALQSYERARELSHACGNRIAESSALQGRGDLQRGRGQLHQAMDSFRQAIRIGSVRDGQPLPVAALAVSDRGSLLYEWNRLDEAEHDAFQAAELARTVKYTFALVSSLQILARVCWVRGDRARALGIGEETEQILAESPAIPAGALQAAVGQTRMHLQMGNTQRALRWAQFQRQGGKSGYVAGLTAIMQARVRIAEGNSSGALRILHRALPPARGAERWGVVTELLVLQALALAHDQRLQPALSSLEEALKLAEPEGYARLFLDEGEPMERLLRTAYRLRTNDSKEYIGRLLEAWLSPQPSEAAACSPDLAEWKPALIDPLSDRELEVLQLIGAGYSNQAIADKLVISLGTVKAHTSNIFRKLDVRSRTQAVSKAGELGLLKP